MKDKYKCGYSKCSLGGIVQKDVAIREGNGYYHPQCLNEKNNKKQIRDIFLRRINKDEPYTTLNRIIDNIINVKEINSEFLLFALCYVIRHKIPLRHAAGLYYVINNDEIKRAYVNRRPPQIDLEKVRTEEGVQFTLKPDENKGWDELLG